MLNHAHGIFGKNRPSVQPLDRWDPLGMRRSCRLRGAPGIRYALGVFFSTPERGSLDKEEIGKGSSELEGSRWAQV